MNDPLTPAGTEVSAERALGRPGAPRPAVAEPASASSQPGGDPLIGARTIHSLRFSGDAGEYFRIWIVNVALTVVTLGIYGAWAKVRTRQYLYGHTWLDGHNFEYLADPVAILKGHLVVGLGFALYTGAQRLGSDTLTYILLGLYFLIFPALAYNSLRFLAANSAYRGLRFRFHGHLSGAYAAHLGWLLLLPFTLGLIYPYAVAEQRRYLLGGAAYGSSRARFRGQTGDVYLIYLVALVLIVGLYVGLMVLVVGVVAVLAAGKRVPEFDQLASNVPLLIVAGLAYVLAIGAFYALGQGVRAALLNWSLRQTHLGQADVGGQVAFRTNLSPWAFGWMQFTNVLAQVFSLGLATPWAMVRRAKFMLGSVQVLGDLNHFQADAATSEAAIGEAASELLGFELGL